MKKRILLTGGTGLIGKNLVEFLKKKYLIKSFGSEINLKNEIEVKKLFSSFKPNILIHLAGLSRPTRRCRVFSGYFRAVAGCDDA